jgi:hypothetical protein
MAILEPTKSTNTLDTMKKIRGPARPRPTSGELTGITPPTTPATEPIVGAVLIGILV